MPVKNMSYQDCPKCQDGILIPNYSPNHSGFVVCNDCSYFLDETIEVNISNMKASPEQVKKHAKALHKRDQWRKNYSILSGAIRILKNDVKLGLEDNGFILKVLQERANNMMEDREDISLELYETAYEWV